MVPWHGGCWAPDITGKCSHCSGKILMLDSGEKREKTKYFSRGVVWGNRDRLFCLSWKRNSRKFTDKTGNGFLGVFRKNTEICELDFVLLHKKIQNYYYFCHEIVIFCVMFSTLVTSSSENLLSLRMNSNHNMILKVQLPKQLPKRGRNGVEENWRPLKRGPSSFPG